MRKFQLDNFIYSVVNGALKYLATDLGIGENTVLQGKSHLLFCLVRSVSLKHELTEFQVRPQFLPRAIPSYSDTGQDLLFTETFDVCYLRVFPCIGWIVSSLLAGATVGSFTGGALADKFGRTRTFQLDVVPLALGALLWSVLFSLEVADFFLLRTVVANTKIAIAVPLLKVCRQ